MAANIEVDSHEEQTAPGEAQGRVRPRRRALKVLLGVGSALVVVITVAAVWFVLNREPAEQLSDNQALAEFRSGGDGGPSDAAGRPAAGVYAATASGRESIGLPGFDEGLGPNAPVTVTHGDGGCFKYRADYNSHHWRSWTFCPTATASFALTGLESWTERDAPGVDVATLSTYSCEQPLDFLWAGATIGEARTGACTGVSDIDGAVTLDAARIEVLDLGTIEIGGERAEVVNLRTTDTFSRAQTGSEVDEWWLDATTGLPLKVVVDASLKGGPSDYSETSNLKLSTLRPAT